MKKKDHNAIVRDRCCFYRSPATEALAWSENMDTLLANQGKKQVTIC
jgi:regulator of G-protein signaling